jgi:hypothetical protein
MYMKNQLSIQTVCPIIALLFFFAMIPPAAVQAQADEKSEHANSLCILKLAMVVKNGNPALSEKARLALKEKALILMENLFKKIELSGISAETIKKYDSILPQGYTEKIMLLADISKAGISTEGKVHALVSAFDISCDGIISGAAIIMLLGFLGIAYFGYFGALMMLGAILCYFGVF